MALKGQGDPRWLVSARDDGKNVNNWHWTESDYTNWAKGRLAELLDGIEIDTSKAHVTTKDTSTTGEVTVNTRKGKTILFYELDVTVKWTGEWKDEVEERKGTIHLPYISEENDDDDFEIKFTTEKDDDIGYKLKEELKKQIVPILRQRVPTMLKELRDNTVSKTNLKLKDAPSAKVLDKEEVFSALKTADKTSTAETKAAASPATPTASKKVSTSSFTTKEKFVCSPEDLYSSILDPNRVRAYAGGDADISPETGKKFRLFGGNVQGENVHLDRPNKIVQKWRFSDWPEGHYSNVEMIIEHKNGKTMLTLTQTGVPEDDRDKTMGGWKDNYFRRIKGIFGFGSLTD